MLDVHIGFHALTKHFTHLRMINIPFPANAFVFLSFGRVVHPMEKLIPADGLTFGRRPGLTVYLFRLCFPPSTYPEANPAQKSKLWNF